MQLADRVGRKYDGQSAAARPPRIPSLRPLPASHCRLVSSSHVSPLCESTPTTAVPEFSISLPLTPNIYCQRQPWLTNNSQVFTQCGTDATNIGRSVAPSG
jgi:hypothetical protein